MAAALIILAIIWFALSCIAGAALGLLDGRP